MSIRSAKRSAPPPARVQASTAPKATSATTSTTSTAPKSTPADGVDAPSAARAAARAKPTNDREGVARVTIEGTLELLASAEKLAATPGALSKSDATRLDAMCSQLTKGAKALQSAVERLTPKKRDASDAQGPDADLLGRLGRAIGRFEQAIRARAEQDGPAKGRLDTCYHLTTAAAANEGATRALRETRVAPLLTMLPGLEASGAEDAATFVRALTAKAVGDRAGGARAQAEYHLARGNYDAAESAIDELRSALSWEPGGHAEIDAWAAKLDALDQRPPRPARSASEVIARGAQLIDAGVRRELDVLADQVEASRERGYGGLRALKQQSDAQSMFFGMFSMFTAPVINANAQVLHQGVLDSEDAIMASPEGQRAVQHMRDLRDALLASSAIGEREATELARQVHVYGGFSDADKAQIRQSTAELLRFTNGRALNSLTSFEPAGQGPTAAARNGFVYLKNEPSKAAIWHELGHHAEYENGLDRQVAIEWVQGRATDKQLKRLRDIPPYQPFAEDQVGYDGRFATPYGGRVYVREDRRGRPEIDATEVISTALERFASPEEMARLYLQDREQFCLVLGLLRGA